MQVLPLLTSRRRKWHLRRAGSLHVEMDKRIRKAVTVGRRLPCREETHSLVERHGLHVLSVHFRSKNRIEGQGVFDKRAADAYTAPGRIDEKGIDMRVAQAHKPNGPIDLVCCNP